MRVEVKFCGLTRVGDARAATDLGARYVGVIFAGGPRNLDRESARRVLDDAGPGPQRVGVFGASKPTDIAAIVDHAHLDVVQLHGDPSVDEVRAVRALTGARVWAVVRVEGTTVPAGLHELWKEVDTLVLDTRVEGALGGTGTSFDWSALEGETRNRPGPLVLAGGLTAANVAEAIEILSPDVVDVSSSVESSPGIKDHERMAEFMDAVRRTGVLR